MRRAKRPVADEPALAEQARHRVQPGHFERLRTRQRGQDRREAAREHRLAGPGRADEERIVSARRRDLEGASAHALPTHVREVELGGPVYLLLLGPLRRDAFGAP